MKSLFEEMGGTYRQEGDYLIPNLTLPDEPEYQNGKYGRMCRSYLKEHRPVLDLLTKWRANPFCGKIVIGGMQHDGTPKQTNGNDFRGY